MEKEFDVLLKSRELLLQFLEKYTPEQLNKIPEGFNNNLYWNVAHIVASQQLIAYRLSGKEMLITEAMANEYRKGTKPVRNVTAEEIGVMKVLLASTAEKTIADYRSGAFTRFQEYTSEFGFTMRTVEDAIAFNNFHEGTHFGIMIGMRRFV